MPVDLRMLFVKCDNVSKHEVLELFPESAGQQGDLVGHSREIESPNGIIQSNRHVMMPLPEMMPVLLPVFSIALKRVRQIGTKGLIWKNTRKQSVIIDSINAVFVAVTSCKILTDHLHVLVKFRSAKIILNGKSSRNRKTYISDDVFVPISYSSRWNSLRSICGFWFYWQSIYN